jgi:hypothetical protein
VPSIHSKRIFPHVVDLGLGGLLHLMNALSDSFRVWRRVAGHAPGAIAYGLVATAFLLCALRLL